MVSTDIDSLFEELKKLSGVEAIALGGSRAGSSYDEKSDYDVYVYCKEVPAQEIRTQILSEYCSYMEIGNHYWEYEDNCILNNGIDIDILYRNLDDFEKGIEQVVVQCQPQNAYTTCMWHNLIKSKILFDRDGRLTQIQKRYTVPYPQRLKENIINHNMNLLRNALPAYEGQIAKAVKRNDLVSINHRVAEFMASYFDVIFAMNRLTHPGEKRLLDLCERDCKILPKNFRENIQCLFEDMFVNPESVGTDVDMILSELECVCGELKSGER